MKNFIKKYFGNFIAKVYISIVRPSINSYINSSQLNHSKIGKKSTFFGQGTVFHPEKLIVGDYCRIGENFFFHALGGISIGNNTILSRNVTIYSANHNFKSDKTLPYDDDYICKSVEIGHSVWIGMNVSILPGVKIGDGAIIAMGSIITKDVNTGEIVASSSQRVIGSRPYSQVEESNNLSFFYELYK